ncbi:MAG: hypothetical protein ABSG63_02390 [Spirochaetia bacterium]
MERKLTPGEISSSVEKIRRRYDEYVSKFFKPRSLREAFERRYIGALRAGTDVSSFLLAEISAIEELVRREEQRIMAGPVRPAAKKDPSIAEKVVEENLKRIAKYPEARFHNDAGDEVRRLVGALSTLERERWPELSTALRDTMYSMNSSEMLSLDSQLRFLASNNRDEVPQVLNRLVTQLRSFPRNYAAIEREEKQYVLEAAFFLNDLFTALERVKRVYTDLAAADKRVLEENLTYVWDLITDFRLKDLKRKRRGGREEA